MIKRVIATSIIFIITIAGLTGCGGSSGFLAGNDKKDVATTTSPDIYIPIEKIRTLNPVITKDEDAYYIDKLIYEGLFKLDKNLTLNLGLAESYLYDENGYSAKIIIKRGVQWQDGEQLTAEDVKFSIDAYLRASYSNNSLFVNNVKNIKSAVLDKSDPYSLTVYFTNNENAGMENLTFPIIPKHKFKNVEAVLNASSGFVPIGTGPYKISGYNELTHITLTGNEKYHEGNIVKNTMNFQIMPDKLDAINLMDVNNISLTFSKKIDRDTSYTNKDINIVPFVSNEVELVGFNFKKSAMQNKKVRKVIAYSIDTQEILEAGYFKNGVLNDTVYFPNYLGVKSTTLRYKFDYANAKKLLAEAGYTDRNGDGVVESIDNENLIVNILVNSEDQSRIAAAQIIKNGLDKLLIQTNVVSKDWDSYNSALASGDYEIYIGGFSIEENYDLRYMLHTNYGNSIGYSNPKLDILLDKMESGLGVEEKASTFSQIKKTLDDDLPYYCLLYKTYGAIASPSLKGDINPCFNNFYNGCENWECVYEVPEAKSE